jgi:hypothetical protein
MAAGLGFKDFTTGEVLTAADVDGYLMQGIWVFASAAARDSAVTSPQEGNACYLKDTNQVLTYSGSAWVAVGGGSPLTTKGDVYGFSTVDARIPIGTNGQILTADSTQALGLKWATAASAAPGSASATVATDQSTTSSTFADLTTAGPAVTITTGTKALIIITAEMTVSANKGGAAGYAVSGATTIAATDTTAIKMRETGGATSFNNRVSVASRLSTLTAGSNTFTMKYRTTSGGDAANFLNREILVIDLGS